MTSTRQTAPKGQGTCSSTGKVSGWESGLPPPESCPLFTVQSFFFFSLLITFRAALPIAEAPHGFSFLVCSYLPFKTYYSLQCLGNLQNHHLGNGRLMRAA